MFSRVRVTNFKCLRDVQVDLGPLTVLIGKNDTGKSSFLEALHLLGRLVAGRTDNTRGPWSLANRLSHGAAVPQIGWDVSIEPTERNRLPAHTTYRLQMQTEQTEQTEHVVTEECQVGKAAALTVEGSGSLYTWKASDGEWNGSANPSPGFNRPQIAHLNPTVAPTLQSARRALSTTVLYHLDPKRLAKESPIIDDDATIPRLEHDGFGLPGVLDYLLGTERASFDAIEHELQLLVPFVKSVNLKPTKIRSSGGHDTGKAISFSLHSKGREIPAPLESDGVLLFLAYLTLIHAPDAPATVLLEEPENGLHPRRLGSVMDVLNRLTSVNRGVKQAQVLLATHSPYLLDHVPPDSVLVFGRRSDGDTVVRPLSQIPRVMERIDAGLSVGEMWFNVGEDELLADALGE